MNEILPTIYWTCQYWGDFERFEIIDGEHMYNLATVQSMLMPIRDVWIISLN